jgi:predicted HicB family RNase H-like nuclease
MEKKRGRPPKRAEQRKSVPLQIRSEPAEKAAFDAAAQLAGASFSTWARERLRLAARKELQVAGKSVAFLAVKTSKRGV